MVRLMDSVKSAPESDSTCRKLPSSVKVEVEDDLEHDHGHHRKRSKLSLLPPEEENFGGLSEYSPLGLRLKKSPSLLDLIQMKLYQGTIPKLEPEVKIEHKGGSSSMGSIEKLKASNFPCSLLKIGSWEYKSKHEGDLVAKCYFAKHKLVWEVLDGGLKNKIEIQWSDIMALKANYPDDGFGTLVVVLARQPLFFRETNPQPRKHTLWQSTLDFTDGQASLQRKHFLQCPQGLLGKHFEKLIQCDPRLNFISKMEDIVLNSPYFETKIDDDGDSHGFGHGFLAQSLETKEDTMEDIDIKLKDLPQPSISMNDLMNQKRFEILKEISQCLFNDSQFTTSSSSNSDEQSIMKRVDSLYSLLKKDLPIRNNNVSELNSESSDDDDDNDLNEPVISRKDSVEDLLLNLPRIASLPRFLFNV